MEWIVGSDYKTLKGLVSEYVPGNSQTDLIDQLNNLSIGHDDWPDYRKDKIHDLCFEKNIFCPKLIQIQRLTKEQCGWLIKMYHYVVPELHEKYVEFFGNEYPISFGINFACNCVQVLSDLPDIYKMVYERYNLWELIPRLSPEVIVKMINGDNSIRQRQCAAREEYPYLHLIIKNTCFSYIPKLLPVTYREIRDRCLADNGIGVSWELDHCLRETVEQTNCQLAKNYLQSTTFQFAYLFWKAWVNAMSYEEMLKYRDAWSYSAVHSLWRSGWIKDPNVLLLMYPGASTGGTAGETVHYEYRAVHYLDDYAFNLLTREGAMDFHDYVITIENMLKNNHEVNLNPAYIFKNYDYDYDYATSFPLFLSTLIHNIATLGYQFVPDKFFESLTPELKLSDEAIGGFYRFGFFFYFNELSDKADNCC